MLAVFGKQASLRDACAGTCTYALVSLLPSLSLSIFSLLLSLSFFVQPRTSQRPERPQVAEVLCHVGGFDSVDDESRPEVAFEACAAVEAEDWRADGRSPHYAWQLCVVISSSCMRAHHHMHSHCPLFVHHANKLTQRTTPSLTHVLVPVHFCLSPAPKKKKSSYVLRGAVHGRCSVVPGTFCGPTSSR